ncbi:hypothetical protein J3R83DRAFT_4924 [Lanmaoa asiatica]|nr:hypothetical protein J3R83DRAFT_4924 [Lanmaoa asiatica]
MPQKKSAKELTPEPSAPVTSTRRGSSASPEKPPGPLSIPVSAEERDAIKVNTANSTDLKNACDDALKRIHLHTDVRLTLGWAGVLVAAVTGLYGWKVEFEQSKPAVWAGFIMHVFHESTRVVLVSDVLYSSYVILTSLQALYAYFVEGDIVFVGRRKTFSKRIITERVTISSRTLPVSASSSQPSSANAPSYSLNITYVQSTSGGKSLLAKNRTQGSKEYSTFFDEKGVMVQEVFETWVGELVEGTLEGKAT